MTTASTTMSAEEQEQLRRTAALLRPITRAAASSHKNAVGMLVFGGLSVVLSLPDFGLPGLAVGALLVATGMVQVRASKRLARADPSAPQALAKNELIRMAGLLAYCALKLTVLSGSGSEIAKQLEGTDTLGLDVAALTDSLNTLIYATCAVVTLVYQGGMARYFLRRRAMIAAYLQCPEWARRIVGDLD
jgi:hypothetical protein